MTNGMRGGSCIYCDDALIGHMVCKVCTRLICETRKIKACDCGIKHTQPGKIRGYCVDCTPDKPDKTGYHYLSSGGRPCYKAGDSFMTVDSVKRGRSARLKGARVEREIVRALQDAGIPAEKVSRSGYSTHDLSIADEYTGEVKARGDGNGFISVQKWKESVDVLFLKSNRNKPLVVLDLDFFTKLMQSHLS